MSSITIICRLAPHRLNTLTRQQISFELLIAKVRVENMKQVFPKNATTQLMPLTNMAKVLAEKKFVLDVRRNKILRFEPGVLTSIPGMPRVTRAFFSAIDLVL